MKDVINPHDKLFKEIEETKENIRDLIESTFPERLLKNLDLTTLEKDNNSYIDNRLKEYYSDLVYNCLYKGDVTVKITILFEHKSYKPTNEYPQLLHYLLNMWDYSLKNKEIIPIVIPVIFYHGKEKWQVRSFSKYFKGIDENLKQFIPEFKYIFTDLNRISDEEIINKKFKSKINKVMVLLLRHMADEEYIKERLKDILFLVKEFFTEEKRGIVISFLVYIMSTTEIDDKYIEKCLNEISPKGGEIAMTTANKLKQEGKLEDARRMLMKGYSIEDIMYITGLSREEIEKLK